MHVKRERSQAVNVVGAFALAAADAMRQAVEQSLNLGGSAPAALVSIGAYPGRSIEKLRRPLGLSQPGALRLVERLEHEGLVARCATAGRGVALSLTESGEKSVSQLLEARETSLRQLLDDLPDAQLRDIAAAAEAVLAAKTESRLDLERLCRLCQRAHCQRCPVSGAAHE